MGRALPEVATYENQHEILVTPLARREARQDRARPCDGHKMVWRKKNHENENENTPSVNISKQNNQPGELSHRDNERLVVVYMHACAIKLLF